MIVSVLVFGMDAPPQPHRIPREMVSPDSIALLTSATRPALRSVALVLSSRRVKLVVVDADERPLGELVGEIVFGGGKARHVAGPPSRATLDAAWDKAVASFGAPTHLFAAPDDPAAPDFARERGLPLVLVEPSIADVPGALRFLEGV